MRPLTMALILATAAAGIASAEDMATAPITIRTEQFARPPYSSAIYYIYEQGDRTICTKLAVCDKYERCDTSYYAGRYIEWLDTDQQPSKTPAVPIAASAQPKHICLTRFGFVKKGRTAGR